MKREHRIAHADLEWFATEANTDPVLLRPQLNPELPHEAENRAVVLYIREIGRLEQLTPLQEAQLLAQAKNGDPKARQRLVKAGLRRVVEISREYLDLGLPLLDLISEGNVGLLNAIDRFEPSQKTPFSAYQTWWIKQSIKRAVVQQSRTIPLNQYRRQAAEAARLEADRERFKVFPRSSG